MSIYLIHYFTLACYRDLVSYLLSYANNTYNDDYYFQTCTDNYC